MEYWALVGLSDSGGEVGGDMGGVSIWPAALARETASGRGMGVLRMGGTGVARSASMSSSRGVLSRSYPRRYIFGT